MNKTVLLPLNGQVGLHAAGEDVSAFLQGQLSCDLRKLSPQRALIGSYNSPKGRMLAVTQLMQMPDHLWIELDRSVADAALKRLRMFVLRAKVALTPLPQSALGLIGNDAADILRDAGLPAPSAPFDCANDDDGIVVMRRAGALPRFSLQGPADALAEIASRLSGYCTEGQDDDWRRADILAGVPRITAATSDHFVAPSANLDLLGGIAYDKGCYTGQEVIARLHYLGQLKRRLVICSIQGPAPTPGSALLGSGGEQSAGEIVDAVADPQHAGQSLATAVVQLSRIDERLRTEAEAPVHIIEQPALA